MTTHYALRRPDGSYIQKRDGRGYKKEIDHNCLYKSLQAMRTSFGDGLHNKTLAAHCGLHSERPAWPGSMTEEYQQACHAFHEEARIARAKLRTVSSEKFFELLEQDGYKVIKVEIQMNASS